MFLVGVADDERDLEAGVIEPAFASEGGAAVVSAEYDDGVFEKVFCFEASDDFSDLGIG